MNERKKTSRPTPKKKPVVGPTNRKPKPARQRKRTLKGIEPDVRRAIPLDYVTTDDVSLRGAPEMARR